MKEDMRGLFYIVKGQYKKDNEELSVSGYDPCADDTVEWYRLLDKKTHFCLCCGRDLESVVRGVYHTIKRYKTAERYFKFVCSITSEDYYEVHYLGHAPLTLEQRNKKVVGRSPRVSPKMFELEEKILECYGDFYEDYIEEMEDLAYQELKEDTPFRKTRSLVKKVRSLPTLEEDSSEERLVRSEKGATPKRSLKKSQSLRKPKLRKV